MRAPLSVIIPTLNAGAVLARTLDALNEGVVAGLIGEVVVSDGGSGDATREIALSRGAVVTEGAAGRGGQMARGARAARGGWLLFLHADTVPEAGWSGAARAHMAAHPGEAGWFRLAFDAGGTPARLVAGWANLRSRLFALPYGDQGLMISRDLYERASGFGDIALMEDVALARRLGRRRLRALDAVAVTGAGRFLDEGWLRRGGRNLWTLARYMAGADPERLARAYQRPHSRTPGA